MTVETDIEPDIRAQSRSREIAELAERQHGVIARRQLVALGMGRRAIGHAVETGRLHVWYRGVYAVGHRSLKREGRWMAAVLAVGPGAALSHRSAAALSGIRHSARRAIEVSAGRKVRGPAGVQVHQARLDRDEVTTVGGIPVTTAARTLVDLAAVLPADQLRKAVKQAQILRLPYPDLARYRGRRGVKNLPSDEPRATLSELEDRFIAFLNAKDLPPPLVNAPLGARTPDFRWPHAKLVVELDGFDTHGTRDAFEDDRARDRSLLVAGWRTIRVTWRQLDEQPRSLANDLRTLLDARA